MAVGAIDVTGFVGHHETHEKGERELKQGERALLTSSGRFQVFYTLLETPHLLFDNPEFDIEWFVKLHKSIGVVIDLIKAVFHGGESFSQLFYNLHVARMK